VRHGPGPLPTETDALKSLVAEHNQQNEWQGPVRYGWFDAALACYALHVTRKLDSLMVTHLDLLSRLKTWNYCPGYQNWHALYDLSTESTISDNVLTNFHLPGFLSLEKRAQFTQALSSVIPAVESCKADDRIVIGKIEALVGQQVGMVSRGPSAENVQILHALSI
jgi:adenylosuccinate synthase